MARDLKGMKIAALVENGFEQVELIEPRKAAQGAGGGGRERGGGVAPGGVMNPDRLRANGDAVRFVKAFTDSNRPVAAICHGPRTLIEAGAVKGRRMTSWPSLQTDLRNAGALWSDTEVLEDRGLVTSRKPDDIPAFNRKMIEVFAGARVS